MFSIVANTIKVPISSYFLRHEIDLGVSGVLPDFKIDSLNNTFITLTLNNNSIINTFSNRSVESISNSEIITIKWIKGGIAIKLMNGQHFCIRKCNQLSNL